MNISSTTRMPRISDKNLMDWYNLRNKGEVKTFKKESGHKFMMDQVALANYDPLKDYMKLVFSQKKHLELFLAETNDIDLAFELFVAPFVFVATEMIKKMPIEYHEYASWYTDMQLKLHNWLERKTLDEMFSKKGPFKEEN